ncbi:MAG: hypothetical protein L0Y58_19815 [Verrucomicrobia subdivision 3 bacterium]|nr:hypothetical protein [Limisphaerales bacterium]
MIASFQNPATEWFVSQIRDELVVAQVHVGRCAAGFELRHVEDVHKRESELRLVSVEEARKIAQFTPTGRFRSLKSAPNLAAGWRVVCRSNADLEMAIDRLYPGAIADLYATRGGEARVTNYREFTGRQTGMYRITTFLNDADAALMIRQCCAPNCCLKQRLWTVEGLAPDQGSQKSIIPCLEPCAVLLEFARKVVRTSQKANAPVGKVLPGMHPDTNSGEEERD